MAMANLDIQDLKVYMSEKEYFSDFTNASALIWKENDIYYDWQDSNNREKFIAFPKVPEVSQTKPYSNCIPLRYVVSTYLLPIGYLSIDRFALLF